MDNWLDEACFDLTIHRLKYKAWINDEEVWRKWIRS